jgi:hypothetical protein
VPSTNVVDQGVAGDHDPGAAVLLELARRSQPRFEAAVVGLEVVVGVLPGAMPGHRQQFVQHRRVGRRLVGDDLDRDRRCRGDGLLEEPSGCGGSRREDTNTSMTWPNWSIAR